MALRIQRQMEIGKEINKPENEEELSEKELHEEKEAEKEESLSGKESQEEKVKNNQDKGFFQEYKVILMIVAVFAIISLLIFSLKFLPEKEAPALEYHPYFNDLEDEYNYNGAYFSKNGQLWELKVKRAGANERISFLFRFSPLEVEDIDVNESIDAYIKLKQTLYLTAEPDIGSIPIIGMSNLGRVTGTKTGLYNIPTFGALTSKEKDKYESLPIITCNNSTDTIGVMWFRLGKENSVELNGNCVIVTGIEKWDLVRASDRIAYEILGIM